MKCRSILDSGQFIKWKKNYVNAQTMCIMYYQVDLENEKMFKLMKWILSPPSMIKHSFMLFLDYLGKRKKKTFKVY